MTIEPVSVILNGVGMGMKTQPQVYEDRARKDAGVSMQFENKYKYL
jgi:hypothetical protein